MIINSSKVKTEALLLFCRDLIVSYKSNQNDIYKVDINTLEFIDKRVEELLKAINLVVQPIDYYIRNTKVSRISIILDRYNFITKNISNHFNQGDQFNPAMLCFALLCTWFAELNINSKEKEFIYFSIYPYGEIYDKLLLNTTNINYKKLNINMLNIAENVINKLFIYRSK